MSGRSEPRRMTAPLDGIRVIDLSRFLSGPFCTQLLADYGADVITVESPRGRELRPAGARDNYFFLSANRGKRSLALDFRQAAGHARCSRACSQRADVLVENYRPGVLAALGFDPHELLRRHPRLIVCSISGFGADGPYAARPGFDPIAQAMSGLMSAHRHRRERPDARRYRDLGSARGHLRRARHPARAARARAERARPARGHVAARGDDRRAVVGRGHVLREREEPGARRPPSPAHRARRPLPRARRPPRDRGRQRRHLRPARARARAAASGCSIRASRTPRRAWRTARR